MDRDKGINWSLLKKWADLAEKNFQDSKKFKEKLVEAQKLAEAELDDDEEFKERCQKMDKVEKSVMQLAAEMGITFGEEKVRLTWTKIIFERTSRQVAESLEKRRKIQSDSLNAPKSHGT
ncbi:unnamed protein product [Calypogeia fissa]